MTWYDTDTFGNAAALPEQLTGRAELIGPKGIALVSVFGEKTTAGWGLRSGFMKHYAARRFWDKPRIAAFEEKGTPFAIVMRSLKVVCLDIDEHDDGPSGLKGVLKLGPIPPTLAETSKSGRGRHLFYSTPADTWNLMTGFGAFEDAIGLLPGVDFRGAGCVYHHSTQRWNDRGIAEMPEALETLVIKRALRRQAQSAHITRASNGALDDLEVIMLHDSLLEELKKPIPAGKRNDSLFALGSKMKLAGVPDWGELVSVRAEEVGLDPAEAAKLVGNIERYA